MQLKSFLSLVEIRTKLASALPFLLGTVYALYHFHSFHIINFLLMLGSLLAIDMTTTALNNYFDYRRAIKKEGYNYEIHNSMVKYGLKESAVVFVIVLMLTVAVLLGSLLAIRTGLVVLLIGMLSFGVGIFYSYGPVPISRTPLGELLSGFFMGFVIIFLSVYIHIFDQGIVSLDFASTQLVLKLDSIQIIYIFLWSLPAICGIANIMLANNICDMDDDIINKRFTLPIYIGKGKALVLFKGLYVIAYADILVMGLVRILPAICSLSLITGVFVVKSCKLFDAEQIKSKTFALSVKNFFILNASLLLLLWVSWIFNGLI